MLVSRDEHEREALRRHLARKDAPTRRAARIATGPFAGEVLERRLAGRKGVLGLRTKLHHRASEQALGLLEQRDDDGMAVYSPPDYAPEQLRPATLPGQIATFEAILCTRATDRNDDIMEPGGATIDPAAPLLLHLDQGAVIGKILKVTTHTDALLAAQFAVADVPLAQDALTLLEMNALRLAFSFFPTAWEPLGLTEGGGEGEGGHHILRFEITAVSLVSIPPNVEAVVSAFRRDKLFSPQMKRFAEAIIGQGLVARSTRPETPPFGTPAGTDHPHGASPDSPCGNPEHPFATAGPDHPAHPAHPEHPIHFNDDGYLRPMHEVASKYRDRHTALLLEDKDWEGGQWEGGEESESEG